jgi:parallel beta-helix repeat protein
VGENESKQVRIYSLRFILLSLFILCVLVTICVFLSLEVKADTYVGGNIDSDTTWNVSGSPYIVNFDIYVQEDITLSIEPDVEVRFNFTDFTVNGHLQAIGTEEKPIRFLSNTDFNWGGIEIQSTGDAVIDWCEVDKGDYGFYFTGLQDCSIENTNISGTTNGIYLRHCSNATLSKVNIIDSYNGVYSYESQGITFSEVHLWNTTSTDLIISPTYSEKKYFNHTFIDCKSNGRPLYYFFDIKDTQFHGLDASQITLSYCDNVTLDQCKVTGGAGITLFRTINSNITNCNISGCENGIELLYAGGEDFIFYNWNFINNNTIINNTDGIRLDHSDYNIISDNQILSNTNGLYSYLSSWNIIFHNNFINNNQNAIQSSSYWYSNSYDNGDEGNYWDDYEGEDIGGDGIGDDSHPIGSGSHDSFPLMVPWTGSLPPDTIPPVFLINPQKSVEALIIPEEFVRISFYVSERGRYEIMLDTDGTAGFEDSTDSVFSGNMSRGENDTLWNGITDQGEYVGDGTFRIQIMIWDRAGNPADEPFDLGTLSIQRDIDRDGHLDVDDAFPEDPHEWSDMDGDGIGDGSDPDLDGDGVENNRDEFPVDPDEWSDQDGDEIGDNEDSDDNDNDIPDIAEIPLAIFILVIPLLVFYYTNKHVSSKKEVMKKEEEKGENETEDGGK